MVWSLSYRPKPDSGPDAEVVEGNLQKLGPGGQHLELEDYSPDGGGGLKPWFAGGSGRRVKPESLPKVIRWKSSRALLDYETAFVKTVSNRFRALIEEIEPGVHQFEPITFIAKDRSPLAERWFWQICNRLDTVHPERTDMVMGNFIWRPNDDIPKSERVGVVFDIAKLGSAKFWYDKHLSGGPYLSDDAKVLIESAGMTGVHFTYKKQA
jgi:hypothetical protein